MIPASHKVGDVRLSFIESVSDDLCLKIDQEVARALEAGLFERWDRLLMSMDFKELVEPAVTFVCRAAVVAYSEDKKTRYVAVALKDWKPSEKVAPAFKAHQEQSAVIYFAFHRKNPKFVSHANRNRPAASYGPLPMMVAGLDRSRYFPSFNVMEVGA